MKCVEHAGKKKQIMEDEGEEKIPSEQLVVVAWMMDQTVVVVS